VLSGACGHFDAILIRNRSIGFHDRGKSATFWITNRLRATFSQPKPFMERGYEKTSVSLCTFPCTCSDEASMSD